MAPWGRKSHSSIVGSSRAAKEVVAIANFYQEFVPEEDKTIMLMMEVEVGLEREFKDDEDVEHQVGD